MPGCCTPTGSAAISINSGALLNLGSRLVEGVLHLWKFVPAIRDWRDQARYFALGLGFSVSRRPVWRRLAPALTRQHLGIEPGNVWTPTFNGLPMPMVCTKVTFVAEGTVPVESEAYMPGLATLTAMSDT